MLNKLHEILAAKGAFDLPENKFVDTLVNAIPFNTVPHKMKLIFALSHMSHFASQFRRNILLWDGAKVPTNNISFVIADSGANKDSSNSKMKSCFKIGYDRINEYLTEATIDEAKSAAQKAGEELWEVPEIYNQYRKPVPPMFMAMTTSQGLIQHISDISKLPAGSGSLYSGEFSDELAGNPHALDNIKVLAEVYDLGNKEATYTKGAEFRVGEIESQPVSSLLVGSAGHLLYDEATRKKFHVAFLSKLARRSWFCYSPEKLPEPDFSNEEDVATALIRYAESIEAKANESINHVKGFIEEVTDANLKLLGIDIKVSEDVFKLYNVYKRYNSEKTAKVSQDSIYALVRAHLQWKALKLAGAIAVFAKSDVITENHFLLAIRYCEMFDTDIDEFSKEISKSPHEFLSDYLQSEVGTDRTSHINIHDIKKRGFSSSIAANKLQELVSLCAGYDMEGIYTVMDGASGIRYERLHKTSEVGISFKRIDNSKLNKAIDEGLGIEAIKQAKIDIARTSNQDLKYRQACFKDIGDLLSGDFAYSPWQFVDGVRGRDNIIGGAKWLILDVDKTSMSCEDAHMVLSGVNHYIALTSDASNEFKYRVVLELDSTVELTDIGFNKFYQAIAEDYGIDADPLPQSQIFFSYANRKILSCLDGVPIPARDYLLIAKEKEQEVEKPRDLPNKEKVNRLNNPRETFGYAFESQRGGRSRNFYKAIRHALDLGAGLDETLELLDDINRYIIEPIDDYNLNRLKEQAMRLHARQ